MPARAQRKVELIKKRICICNRRCGQTWLNKASDQEAIAGLPLICESQVVEYLPSFYFGSLLIMFGVEILSDWLLHSWAKVTKKEYLLLWATFIAVMLGKTSGSCLLSLSLVPWCCFSIVRLLDSSV